MSGPVFYWIGVGVVGTIAAGAVLAALVVIYYALIARRFQLILFRKTQRRMSLASWHNAKLLQDEGYHADDWPLAQRPFFLSYQVFGRHIFLLAGILEGRRSIPISGKHPENPA